MDIPASLSVELIASGVVGLLLGGVLLRRVIEGYVEARRHLNNPGPQLSAFSAMWDRDQIERLMQLMERAVNALEKQAMHQSELADRQNHDMQTRLDYLVQRLDELPTMTRRRPRRTGTPNPK